MGISKLANYIDLTDNYNARTKPIKKIAIHHMAGCLSVKECVNVFHHAEASTHYGINGSDIGAYVDENNRAWALANREADMETISIELANDRTSDWHVSDKTIETCIKLCVDICKRNGIKKLNFTGNKEGNLVQHRWYSSTLCPGNYLASKFPYIAREVNKALEAPTKIKYRVHQQSYGWSDWVEEGTICGVVGEAKRLEAIQIDAGQKAVYVKIHLQGIGWVDYGRISKDIIIGTIGQARRIEAIEINGMKVKCHIQGLGWADNFSNLQGTLGLGKRIESIILIS